MTTKKELRDYWFLNRFDVKCIENKSKLIYSVKEGVSSMQFYVTDTTLCHILHDLAIVLYAEYLIEC